MIASLIDVTLGLVLVLLLRRPARRVFGAGPAFALWIWPPLLAVAPWLPSLPDQLRIAPAMMLATTGTTLATPLSHGLRGEHLMAWVLLTGALTGIPRLVLAYLRIHKSCVRPDAGFLTEACRGVADVDPLHIRWHPDGPAVLCGRRNLILLPHDFLTRFDSTQRMLVLRHEISHLRRWDPLWRLLAECFLVVLWFHPLAWLARARFQLDQELACDDYALRHYLSTRTDYARTLMHGSGLRPIPSLIPWLTEPQLKERLTMIKRHRAGMLRHRVGWGLLLMAGISLGFAVQAAPQSQTVQIPVLRPLGNESAATQQSPRYPAMSIRNREQGIVVLQLRIGTDGQVKAVDYDPKGSTTTSAVLIGAASNAALQWRFAPAMENGKPVESYKRVPVDFRMNEI